eukprot:Gb_21791 [translate_table: standard]
MASKMVSELTGMSVQPHKAIVGANAFAHESGIHQASRSSVILIVHDKAFLDGMLKFKGTYEILSPEDIGLVRADESGIVLGKLRFVSLLPSKATVFLPKKLVISFSLWGLGLRKESSGCAQWNVYWYAIGEDGEQSWILRASRENWKGDLVTLSLPSCPNAWRNIGVGATFWTTRMHLDDALGLTMIMAHG